MFVKIMNPKYWKVGLYQFVLTCIYISYITSILGLVHASNSAEEIEESELPTQHPRIAIIGGGIGGTATAYLLRKFYKENISLYLYENEKIGGRLQTSLHFDRKYEAGGAIIHPDNLYMNNFIEELGLKKNYGCQSKAGIFNGEEYAFIESDWSFINIIKAFLRYGLDLYWLQTYNSRMLKSFAKIYDHQRQGLSFKTVEAMLHSMDSSFPSLVRKSFRSYLKENKFHDLIIDELVAACTRANYGQSPDIHAFVGSVSVAAASPDLWSVAGGNQRVPEELLKNSEAHLLQQRVTRIAEASDGKFKVWSTSGADGTDEEEREFDAIAIATPLTKDKSRITFANFSTPLNFPGRFERIVCTLVEGALNKTTFKYEDVGVRVEEILTDNPSLTYNSVGKQDPVGGDDRCSSPKGMAPVFKVFSPDVLTETQLRTLFERYHRVEVIDWLAYPHYHLDESLGNFELIPGLYYNNAVERAASAMEMSAIAAHNTALLIKDFLNGGEPNARPVSGEPNARPASGKEEL